MLIAIIVLWIICAYLCCKVEGILTNQETWSSNLVIALFVWPLVFPFLIFVKHYVGIEEGNGKRVDGIYPDMWRY